MPSMSDLVTSASQLALSEVGAGNVYVTRERSRTKPCKNHPTPTRRARELDAPQRSPEIKAASFSQVNVSTLVVTLSFHVVRFCMIAEFADSAFSSLPQASCPDLRRLLLGSI